MNKCLAAGWLVFVFVSALTESFHGCVADGVLPFHAPSGCVRFLCVRYGGARNTGSGDSKARARVFIFCARLFVFQREQAHEEGGAVCIGRRFPDRNRPALFRQKRMPPRCAD